MGELKACDTRSEMNDCASFERVLMMTSVSQKEGRKKVETNTETREKIRLLRKSLWDTASRDPK